MNDKHFNLELEDGEPAGDWPGYYDPTILPELISKALEEHKTVEQIWFEEYC